MKITVGVGRTVVVNDDVNTLHIDTTTKNIRGDENSLLKRFESRITLDTRKRKTCEIADNDISIRLTALLAANPSE